MSDSFEKQAALAAASILLETNSVHFSPDEPFTFTSGRKSPVYIDCRRLIPNRRQSAETFAPSTNASATNSPRESIRDTSDHGMTGSFPLAQMVLTVTHVLEHLSPMSSVHTRRWRAPSLSRRLRERVLSIAKRVRVLRPE
jgi:hypothetical protein